MVRHWQRETYTTKPPSSHRSAKRTRLLRQTATKKAVRKAGGRKKRENGGCNNLKRAGDARQNKCGQANNAESRGFSITANSIVHPKAEIPEIKLQVISAIVNSTSAEHASADVPVVFPLI
ncbi:hypothetical protein D4R75_08915 [bacterium]|nr:MAG: hypothetical protein D4R75_08915 [bacterium]